MSSFRRALVVTRKTAGTVVDGLYVEGVTSSINITASVQPLMPEEVDQLPEGKRTSDPRWLFTYTELNPASSANPDLVSIDGSLYEVDKVGQWQNNVINHYKCLVYKQLEA